MILKKYLEREGFSCFLDVDDILTGLPWKPQLRKAVGGCDILIALVNDRFVTSRHHKYGCLAEVKHVKDRGKVVMPVLLDGFQVEAGSELERLVFDSGAAQYQEWSDKDDLAFLERMSRHIRFHGVLPVEDKLQVPAVLNEGADDDQMMLSLLWVMLSFLCGCTLCLKVKLSNTQSRSADSQLWSIAFIYIAVAVGLGSNIFQCYWPQMATKAFVLMFLCGGVVRWIGLLNGL